MTAQLVTNDYNVADTVVDVLGYRIHDGRRYVSVRLALAGDHEDTMCLDMHVGKLEIREAAA